MKPLKNFEEFLRDGTVRKISPDTLRAKSLVEEAERRNKFLGELLEKIRMNDENANYFIESSYDILISLIRAKLLSEGFSSSGKGAHEAEVSFMRKLGFPEKDVRFMNDLRYYRNGILYYGKKFDADYGKKVLDFMNKIFAKLKT
jgi:hypothetical protein